MAVPLPRRPFTAAEYDRLIEVGILGEDDRVELIEGEIVQMPPVGSRHAAVVGRTHEGFVLRFSDVALVFGQSPIRLNDHSEPFPDLLLLRRRSDFYATALPTPEDVFLLVEVADSSLDADCQVKLAGLSRPCARGGRHSRLRPAWLAPAPTGIPLVRAFA